MLTPLFFTNNRVSVFWEPKKPELNDTDCGGTPAAFKIGRYYKLF